MKQISGNLENLVSVKMYKENEATKGIGDEKALVYQNSLLMVVASLLFFIFLVIQVVDF